MRAFFHASVASLGLALILGGVEEAFGVEFPLLTYAGTGCLGAVLGSGAGRE